MENRDKVPSFSGINRKENDLLKGSYCYNKNLTTKLVFKDPVFNVSLAQYYKYPNKINSKSGIDVYEKPVTVSLTLNKGNPKVELRYSPEKKIVYGKSFISKVNGQEKKANYYVRSNINLKAYPVPDSFSKFFRGDISLYGPSANMKLKISQEKADWHITCGQIHRGIGFKTSYQISKFSFGSFALAFWAQQGIYRFSGIFTKKMSTSLDNEKFTLYFLHKLFPDTKFIASFELQKNKKPLIHTGLSKHFNKNLLMKAKISSEGEVSGAFNISFTPRTRFGCAAMVDLTGKIVPKIGVLFKFKNIS